jgi:hypothetical protein
MIEDKILVLRGNIMKYTIDIDALKDCLDLLPRSYSDVCCVDLGDVKKMIDAFPKEEVKEKTTVLR